MFWPTVTVVIGFGLSVACVVDTLALSLVRHVTSSRVCGLISPPVSLHAVQGCAAAEVDLCNNSYPNGRPGFLLD